MDNTLRLPVGYEIAPPDHIVGEDDLCRFPNESYWRVNYSVGGKVGLQPVVGVIIIRPIQQPKQEEQLIPTPPEGYTVISDLNYIYKEEDYFWANEWIPCEATVGQTIREILVENLKEGLNEFPYAATDLREEETILVRKVIDHLTERYINSLERENKMSEEKKTAVMREKLEFQLSYLNEPGFFLTCYNHRTDPTEYAFEFDELKMATFNELTEKEAINLFDELIDGLSQMRLRVLKDIK